MILTTHYVKDSKLADKQYVICNDDRRVFFAKNLEAFPLWYQYIRKNYPDEHIVMFDEPNSPIKIQESLKSITEEVEFIDSYEYNENIKFHIKNCSKMDNVTGRSEKGYRQTVPVSRSYLDALNFAYYTNNDFLYVDLDCFLNTNIYKLLDNNCDIAAQNISHFQFTIDAYCLFISKKRLHEMDYLYKLPDFLNHIFYDTSDIVRIYTFFEGGLFKNFCYGNAKALTKINVTHNTNCKNLIEFLERNPLNTNEYKYFLELLKGVDLEALKKDGCKVDFDDSTFYE